MSLARSRVWITPTRDANVTIIARACGGALMVTWTLGISINDDFYACVRACVRAWT